MENASKALIIAGAILIAILLITIGIVLINSGSDVTSTGTTTMNSQKIQAFNSQFTGYEGTHKGSEIKSLINEVNSSNASDSEHQVAINSTVSGVTSAGKLQSTKSYVITLTYATSDNTTAPSANVVSPTNFKTEAGYVYLITISES